MVLHHPRFHGSVVSRELFSQGHGQFRRRGRRRRPEVGDEIGDGKIRFMAYRRNDGNLGAEDFPCDPFIVERGKVFQRTASPGQNDDIDIPVRRADAPIALIISAGASAPCTRTGAIRMSTEGQRLLVMFRMSLMTAPVGEVMTPILPGEEGKGFFVPGHQTVLPPAGGP